MNYTPYWMRRLQRVLSMLMGGMSDWKDSMPDGVRKRYDAACERFAAELQAIVEGEDE
jgi:hypothetical protein